MTEREYRAYPAINYSTLKNIAKNPKQIISKFNISDYPSVKQGNLLDLKFQGEDAFKDVYAYFDGEVPTASALILADKLIHHCITIGEKPSNDLAIQIINSNDLWASTKDTIKVTKKNGTEIVTSREDKLLCKFDDACFWNYVQFKIDTQDKILIDKETFYNVETAYNTILNHNFTKEIFKRKQIYQEAIIFDFKFKDDNLDINEKCKILPDVITIDEKSKIIYPFDFKFMSGRSAYSFPMLFLTMYYYLQSSLYSYGIKKWAQQHYPDYHVYHYQFIVISDKNLSYPLVYNPFNYIALGLQGFEKNGKDYPGIVTLIEDYKWHKENDLWDFKRDVYENNGIIKL